MAAVMIPERRPTIIPEKDITPTVIPSATGPKPRRLGPGSSRGMGLKLRKGGSTPPTWIDEQDKDGFAKPRPAEVVTKPEGPVSIAEYNPDDALNAEQKKALEEKKKKTSEDFEKDLFNDEEPDPEVVVDADCGLIDDTKDPKDQFAWQRRAKAYDLIRMGMEVIDKYPEALNGIMEFVPDLTGQLKTLDLMLRNNTFRSQNIKGLICLMWDYVQTKAEECDTIKILEDVKRTLIKQCNGDSHAILNWLLVEHGEEAYTDD
jgi:hypothetical protein